MLFITIILDIEDLSASKNIVHPAFQPFKPKHLPESPIEPSFIRIVSYPFLNPENQLLENPELRQSLDQRYPID